MIRKGGGTVQAWKLLVEYDGSRYRGWQSQKNARSVQATLRDAAEDLLGTKVELHGAGRTDAGVHALGQVAHLKAGLPRSMDGARLLAGLNAALPSDVVVLRMEPVHPRFHARHHALSRTYLYRISTRKQAFAKRYVWWIKEPLELGLMQTAAAWIVGRHDFKPFSVFDPARPDESTIVVVEACGVLPVGDEVHVRIEASHFLWKMARRLVGALVRVGSGSLGLDQFRRLLEGAVPPDTDVGAWTAPAAGLFLESVRYGPASPLELP